jgi:hypothetical protein
MTAEWVPYLQLLGLLAVFVGVCITLATIIFYGGKLVAKVEATSARVDNIEEVLFGKDGTVKKTNDHDYHIQNVCGVAANRRP